jgi:hypothetical protein
MYFLLYLSNKCAIYVNNYLFLITHVVHLLDEYNKIYKMHGTYIKTFKRSYGV